MAVEAPVSPADWETAFQAIVAGEAALAAGNPPAAIIVGTIIVAGLVIVALFSKGPTEEENIRAAIQYWQAPEPRQVPSTMVYAGMGAMRRRAREAEAQARRQQAEADRAASSPSEILQMQVRALAREVATHEVWRRGHRSRVHIPTNRAWFRYGAAEAGAAGAIAGAVDAVADALQELVKDRLPRLERRLRTAIDREAQARARGDTALARQLARQVSRLSERILRVVEWVTFKVIPEIEADIDKEASVRAEQDRRLTRGLVTETRTRAEADASILAQLAPLAAFVRGPVAHATDKVHRNEEVFDQLLRTNLDWLGILLLPPSLTRLVTKVLVDVAPHIPEALIGFEEAAWKALGAV